MITQPIRRLIHNHEMDKPLIRGAGDVIALVAQPAVRLVDAVAGTKLSNCGRCADRQRKLNATLPNPATK